ncbi:MAG TPA: SusC/RagA family TonB-linked outer membrane protein [Longimicrobiales bacterium]
MNRSVRRVLIAIAVVVLLPTLVFAQGRQVGGHVTDQATGQPLAGAQIVVRGTTIGTLTDGSGNYTIRVPEGSNTLVFSYIGYRTVEAEITGAVVDVAMEVEAIGLEGLVVTALGIEREQRSLTYAAQSVSGDRLNQVPKTNVVSALAGRVAGVRVTSSTTPGGSARIVLRGVSSITGNNQPLIVVDGIPIDNSAPSNDGYADANSEFGGFDTGNAAADINPADIASITVLKGPNAAALYGARAANGAIEITTKTGRGQGSTGLGLTATMGMMFSTPLRIPDYQDQYGQGQYGEFEFVDGNGGGVNDGVDESWGPRLDGRTTGCVFVRNADGDPIINQTPAGNMVGEYDQSRPCRQFFGEGPWVAHPDNVRNFFPLGIAGNVNVAVARSSDRSSMRLSIGRSDDNAMYPNARIARTNVSLNGSTAITDRLSAEASLNYILNDRSGFPGTGYDDIAPMQGFIWFGRQVDLERLKNNRTLDPNDPLAGQIMEGSGFRTDAPIPYTWNYTFHQNPYWVADNIDRTFKRDRVIGHLSATYKFNDWLTLTGRAGRDWYQHHFRVNYPVNNISPNPLGGFMDRVQARSETNADLLLTANRALTPDIALTVNVGGNIRANDFDDSRGVVSELVIPGVYTLQNSAGQPATSYYIQKKRVNSIYGSANLSYRNWLSLDLTGRNDWSSTLPEDANSFFYPSVGAAVVLTDALGIDNSFLSYGKVRGSWTRVGNDTDPYQLAAVYSAGTPWGGQPGFTVPNNLPNTNLKPEQTTGWEVGADLGFLNDRVILNATYYSKTSTNQIFAVDMAPSSGYSSRVVNAGSVENHGIELVLNTTPLQLDNGFRWDVVANWSKNTNKVLELFGGNDRVVIGNYWGVDVTADVGQPYGNLVGTKWMRTDDGKIIVDDSTGLPITDGAPYVLGNYNPDWTGGIRNTFTYKNLSLSFLLDGQWGGEVYSVTKWFGQYSGVLEATLRGREEDWCTPGFVVPNSVREDGTPNTTVVCPQDYWHNSFDANEEGIIDASYLKLRDARLGIRLPTDFVQSLGFSEASVALVGQNLFLWAKQDIIDPETAFDTGNRQGVENAQYPTARRFGFTLSVRP